MERRKQMPWDPTFPGRKTPNSAWVQSFTKAFHSINFTQGYHYTFLIMSCFVTSITVLNGNEAQHALNLGYELSWKKNLSVCPRQKAEMFYFPPFGEENLPQTSQPHTVPKVSGQLLPPKCPELPGAEGWVQTSLLKVLTERLWLNVVGDT